MLLSEAVSHSTQSLTIITYMACPGNPLPPLSGCWDSWQATMPTRHSHGFWGVVSPQLVLMVAEQALCLLSYLHSPSLIFLRQRGLADWLGWLASKTVLSSPPHQPWDYLSKPPCPAFYMGAGGPNPCPQACTVFHQPSPLIRLQGFRKVLNSAILH